MQGQAQTKSQRPAGQVQQEQSGPEPARALVLVADDRRRRRVCAALERDGHEVLATRSGQRAATVLKDARHCPDVVVLDMRLPHADGVAFAGAYRRAPAPHPPIILVPSQEQTGLTGQAPQTGEPSDTGESAVNDAALDLVRARVRLHGAQLRERRRIARTGRASLLVAACLAAALVAGAAAAAPVFAWAT